MGYAMINPEHFEIATVECTLCHVTIHHPTEAERMEFSAAHLHGNPTLTAWFERAAERLRAAEEPESDDYDDEDDGCQGHPDGPVMGETFYCDGSCER